MSYERKKIEVGIGEKGVPPEGAEIVEAGRFGGDEVGGRYRSACGGGVVCPHCGVINSIIEDATSQQWYTCGNCGGLFYH